MLINPSPATLLARCGAGSAGQCPAPAPARPRCRSAAGPAAGAKSHPWHTGGTGRRAGDAAAAVPPLCPRGAAARPGLAAPRVPGAAAAPARALSPLPPNAPVSMETSPPPPGGAGAPRPLSGRPGAGAARPCPAPEPARGHRGAGDPRQGQSGPPPRLLCPMSGAGAGLGCCSRAQQGSGVSWRGWLSCCHRESLRRHQGSRSWAHPWGPAEPFPTSAWLQPALAASPVLPPALPAPSPRGVSELGSQERSWIAASTGHNGSISRGQYGRL